MMAIVRLWLSFGSPMCDAPTPLRILRFASFAMLVSLAYVAFAQDAKVGKTANPSRLPQTEKELIEQLPDGCVASWLGSRSNSTAFSSGAETVCGAPSRLAQDSIQGATPPTPHQSLKQNPFAAPVSRQVSHRTAFQQASTGDDRLLSLDDQVPRKPRLIAKEVKPDSRDKSTATPNDPLSLLSDDLLSNGAGRNGLMNGPSDQRSDGAEDLLGDGPESVDPLTGLGPDSGPIRKRSAANDQAPIAPSADTAKATASHPLDALYPSAQTCAKCHPKHYDQWRVSNHAYASISPMFQRFEQAMQDLTQGTVGSFCFRCHSPIATQISMPPSSTLLDAPPVVREGITCVVCHRVKEAVGRTHGDRRIEPGDIHAPIYGSTHGEGVRDAIANAKEHKLKLSADEKGPGQPMHQHCGPFEPITKSDYCASCHQVAVHPGIWLEIVHAQYRSGPAHDKGITCQQCHMGSEPGKPTGYEFAHVAELSGKPFGEPRKQSNHMFWGPGYSIAHPGVFPHNPDANRYSPRQWLLFEYRSGWGTKEFEKNVPEGMTFPPPWDNQDERIDGRKVIDANLRKLDEKRSSAILTLAAGARVDGPIFDGTPTTSAPLKFSYRVCNTSEGHNMPTGSLGAQPQMWLNVALINPQGKRIWESGYLDRNGDLADLQSVEVNHHRLPRDSQLFNLQTKFLVNNIRGTDREAPVPLNFSLDQLIFLRPGAVPVSVLNHPPLIRMEAHSIPPLDHRMACYSVPAHLMTMPGLYRLSVRLRSRPEPPYFMRLVGASPEMIRRLNENILDVETDSYTFAVDGPEAIAMPKRHLLR